MNLIINTLTTKEFNIKIQDKKIESIYYKTKFGIIQILSTDLGIHSAKFIDDTESLKIENCNTKIDLNKIVLIGTPFQIKVWQSLLQIPNGQTTSYQNIAEKINHLNSWRAVANAIANNKIAYFVPCHRVIQKNNTLGGYRWGIERKKQILAFEKSF